MRNIFCVLRCSIAILTDGVITWSWTIGTRVRVAGVDRTRNTVSIVKVVTGLIAPSETVKVLPDEEVLRKAKEACTRINPNPPEPEFLKFVYLGDVTRQGIRIAIRGQYNFLCGDVSPPE